jgi:hypothetical protein
MVLSLDEYGLRQDRLVSGWKRRGMERVLFDLGIVLAFLVMASAAMLTLGEGSLVDSWLWISPAVLCGACLVAAFRIIRADIQAIASPVFWMILASSVYWGFGPLIYTFGGWNTIVQLNAEYYVGPSELFLTNMLNSVGMLALVAGVAVGRRLVGRRWLNWVRRCEGMDALRAAGMLAAVGLTAKFGMVLPLVFGLIGTQSSTLLQMQVLSKAALMILSYLSVTRGGKATVWFILLFAVEFLTAGLVSSKMVVLEVIIAVLVGRTLAVGKTSLVVKGFVVLGLLQFVLQPVVSGYRMMDRATGGNYAISVAVTGRLMAQSLSDLMHGSNAAQKAHPQSWWSRLCYAPQQAFAMQEYDSGRAASPWGDFAMGLVPRVIWPDKPLITPGVHFSVLMSGNPDNNNAPGVLGEGYWYGGWLGVLAVCLYAGVFLGGSDRVSSEVISRRAWTVMPLVFIGIRSGYRVDGWFSTEFLFGSIWYVLFAVSMLFLSAFYSAIAPRKPGIPLQ